MPIGSIEIYKSGNALCPSMISLFPNIALSLGKYSWSKIQKPGLQTFSILLLSTPTQTVMNIIYKLKKSVVLKTLVRFPTFPQSSPSPFDQILRIFIVFLLPLISLAKYWKAYFHSHMFHNISLEGYVTDTKHCWLTDRSLVTNTSYYETHSPYKCSKDGGLLVVTLMLGTHFRELKVQYLTKMENVLHVCIRRNQCAVQWGVYGKQHWWWSDNDARKVTGLANYYGDIKSNTTWKCNLEGWMSMHTQFQIKATTFKM